MRLTRNKQQDVPGVAERWKKQYCCNGQWSQTHTGDAEIVYQRLLSAVTPADVAAIIGNDSWTGESYCNECGVAESVVMLGEEPDYESATVFVCAACLRKAVALIEEPVTADAVDPQVSSTGKPSTREKEKGVI